MEYVFLEKREDFFCEKSIYFTQNDRSISKRLTSIYSYLRKIFIFISTFDNKNKVMHLLFELLYITSTTLFIVTKQKRNKISESQKKKNPLKFTGTFMNRLMELIGLIGFDQRN